ncbi:hypothetical protein [Halorubrum miltondacostae]|uniref:Uncharacterized protein n=1 Tax=Halorubrum miltondacostae TaxID=3076378 RepID=A0ABD5LW61_9EURY
MNAEIIGRSVLYEFTVVLILAALWPFLPTSGSFSQIPAAIDEISDFVIPAVVVGAPAVAYHLLSEW